MKTRSRVVIASAVLGGCLVLFACAAVAGVTGYLLLTHTNPLSAFAPAVSNKLVYVGNDMNLFVVDPTGQHQTRLTTDADAGDTLRYDFPTWAPDSRHIAFVGIDYSGNNATGGKLYSVEPSGANLRTLYQSSDSIPFYLYWAPDSRNLSFLTSKGNDALSLQVASDDTKDSAHELDSGTPLYWAWSPDARNMLLHVGGTRSDSNTARLSLVAFSANRPAEQMPSSPGDFHTPQWSSDGKSIFYSQQADNGKQELMTADPQGKNARSLVDYDGRISFAVSPQGNRIAYIATTSDMQLPTFGKVHVMGIDGSDDQSLSDNPALAIIWSPNGKRIAYLTVPTGGGSTGYRFKGQAQTGNSITLEWVAYDLDTKETHTIAQFTPTSSFLNVIPVFDQYTRSATFWSPDSLQFVYSNEDDTDKGSIWVANADGKDTPHKVGDGLIAFWSWK